MAVALPLPHVGEGSGEKVIAKTISLATTLSPGPSPASGRGEQTDGVGAPLSHAWERGRGRG
jgi:hypothetical protein